MFVFRSFTCPQCREICTTDTLIKIYVELSDDHGPTSLRGKSDSLVDALISERTAQMSIIQKLESQISELTAKLTEQNVPELVETEEDLERLRVRILKFCTSLEGGPDGNSSSSSTEAVASVGQLLRKLEKIVSRNVSRIDELQRNHADQTVVVCDLEERLGGMTEQSDRLKRRYDDAVRCRDERGNEIERLRYLQRVKLKQLQENIDNLCDSNAKLMDIVRDKDRQIADSYPNIGRNVIIIVGMILMYLFFFASKKW